MAVALAGGGLEALDGVAVSAEERRGSAAWRGRVAHCVAAGLLVRDPARAFEEAGQFLLGHQRAQWPGAALALEATALGGAGPQPVEGEAAAFFACLRGAGPRRFASPHFAPAAFALPAGAATSAQLIGSMTRWAAPVELARAGAEFAVELYLPPGAYEFQFVVDGEPAPAEGPDAVELEGRGRCYRRTVASPELEGLDALGEEAETILHVRWMRSTPEHGFELIENENSLSYIPTKEDIGLALRAEVLAYIEGQFSFLYFDLSTPVLPGEPSIRSLAIEGSMVEGNTIYPVYTYFGGEEGWSTVKWYRMIANRPNSLEEIRADPAIDGDTASGPAGGYTLQKEDIGKQIVVEVTPVRDDWVAGLPIQCFSAPVAPGVPRCTNIVVLGELTQGAQVTVAATYTGGIEGNSLYQWFRHDEAADSFTPIPDQVLSTYTLTLGDVGRRLAVEYIPVSREGIHGETARLVLDMAILPASPVLANLSLKGNPQEGSALSVDFEYSGGHPGTHVIEWFAVRGTEVVPLAEFRNSTTCKLSLPEVGCFIQARVTPVRSDKAKGETVQAITTEAVAPADPQVLSMSITPFSSTGKATTTEELTTGCRLVLSTEYTGGNEGNSETAWYRMDADGAYIPIEHNGSAYTIADEDSGATIKVVYIPIRSDLAVGEMSKQFITLPPFEVKKSQEAQGSVTTDNQAALNASNTELDGSSENAHLKSDHKDPMESVNPEDAEGLVSTSPDKTIEEGLGNKSMSWSYAAPTEATE